MHNFTLYGQPYLVSGKCIKPYLTIQSLHPYDFYKRYDYFAVNVSTKPMPLAKCTVYNQSSAEEYLTRARRVVLFTDSTCFKPVQYNDKQFGNLADRFYKAGSSDHVSFWKSSLGTKFILNESYSVDPDYRLNLGSQGLIAIIIPTDLSPYCGGWNETSGAKPRTISYLICDYKNLAEVRGLEIAIRNTICIPSSFNSVSPPLALPAWNDVKGVQHV